jgi:NAD(P)-dependent dehydrogenase (short-subunit alcohol dehydrogenase family)
MSTLQGKVIWVTGAGSGVGEATVKRLATDGAKVAALGRRAETVDAVAKAAGGGTVAIGLDVGDRARIDAVAGELLDRWGHVDVLVNSAGLNVADRRFNVLAANDFDRMVEVNLTGPFNMIRAVLPAMRERRQGLIVNVASMAGKTASSMSGPGYCSSKHGLVGLSHTVNVEEWRNGIRCTALCPGEINTPFIDRRSIVPGQAAREQMMQPEDVAEIIAFLGLLNPRITIPELWCVPTVHRPNLPGEDV